MAKIKSGFTFKIKRKRLAKTCEKPLGADFVANLGNVARFEKGRNFSDNSQFYEEFFFDKIVPVNQ